MPLLFALILQTVPEVTRVDLLPPGPGNPRNSEGDFLALPGGRLLFAYTRFSGGAGDEAPAEIAGRTSTDGGKTWSAKDVVLVPRDGKMNVMSVSLLPMADGRPGLFYLKKDSMTECRMILRRSADQGRTFGEPELCIPDAGYFVVNNDRVVRLKSGRLVIPAARHSLAGAKWVSRAVAVCYLSDDDGATWRRSTSEIAPPQDGRSGLQEPLVVELRDGRLLMLARTDLGCQYASVSADGGDAWSPAEPSGLASPLSPASCTRIPSTGDLLLVWNDHSKIDASLKGKRTPLSVAVSKDDGRTWSASRTLETDPDGWYCYTAIEFVDSRVLLAYCAGDSKIGRLNRTRITTFGIPWLYQ